MRHKSECAPGIIVFTTLFPHPGQPQVGLFIRERMFRVGRKLPLVVVAPVPWFPMQGLIRLWRPHYRPIAPRHEIQDGFDVYHPKFFSMPGLLRTLDGLFMAFSCFQLMRQLKKSFNYHVIDAHFACPDGYAASLLGKWLKVPVTITLRGTEVPLSKTPRRRQILKALERATRVFSVADSLRKHVISLGADSSKIKVVGNGVDIQRFYQVPRSEARKKLGLSERAKILITVGSLVERKGFHRVIELLPELRKDFPNIQYLIVGGVSAEGDWTDRLKKMVSELGVSDHVKFLGVVAPDELKIPLSAADVFVLPTRNEGWANVILEAMACGLPVVATNVGGNGEVITKPDYGVLVPFEDSSALYDAIQNSLHKEWDRNEIIEYANKNSWDDRVATLISEFQEISMNAT